MASDPERTPHATAEAVIPAAGPPDRAWRRVPAVVAAVVAVPLLVAGGLLAVPRSPAAVPADQSGVALPAEVVVPPGTAADVRYAPPGNALVVYHRENLPGSGGADTEPLAVIGPGDRYRVYDRPEWTVLGTQSFLLSPDGRYLLMPDLSGARTQRSRVFDMSTGAVRTLSAGAPLAWSPDGRQAILVGFAGDPTGAAPVAAEIRVVQLPGERVVWRIPVPAEQPAGQRLAAALSPDGTAIAVQHGGVLTIHRREGTDAGYDLGGAALAGPAAWTPDGGELLLTPAPGRLTALDARTGVVDPGRRLPALTPNQVGGAAAPPPERVVAWRGQDPVVVVGDRAVLLTGTPQVLVRAPADTDELQIAAAGAGSAPRPPGPPDPGPLPARYRAALRWAPVPGLLAVVAAALLWARRRRRDGEVPQARAVPR